GRGEPAGLAGGRGLGGPVARDLRLQRRLGLRGRHAAGDADGVLDVRRADRLRLPEPRGAVAESLLAGLRAGHDVRAVHAELRGALRSRALRPHDGARARHAAAADGALMAENRNDTGDKTEKPTAQKLR